MLWLEDEEGNEALPTLWDGEKDPKESLETKSQKVAGFADNLIQGSLKKAACSKHDDTQEASILKQTGVEYHNIAIDGAKGLSMANIEALDKVLNNIDQDKNVLMHCASGNRVGAMMALRANWLQGANKDEALAIGEKYGLTSLKTTVSFKLKEHE